MVATFTDPYLKTVSDSSRGTIKSTRIPKNKSFVTAIWEMLKVLGTSNGYVIGSGGSRYVSRYTGVSKYGMQTRK